jgi:hypothetical protein
VEYLIEMKGEQQKQGLTVRIQVLNHHLSQKLKLIGIDEFNHLIYIITGNHGYNKKHHQQHNKAMKLGGGGVGPHIGNTRKRINDLVRSARSRAA